MRKNINNTAIENPVGSGVPISAYPSNKIDGKSIDNLKQITHDIHGSINIIIGYSQIMLDEANGKINTEQREALQYILKHGNRLYDLTNNVIKRLETD
jgi:hypothetical protein